MKKFLVFAGGNFYLGGGWDDFIESFDNLEDARKAVPQNVDWFQIVDRDSGQIVEFFD